MARVLALIPDLLFGSRVQADFAGAGHDIELVGSADLARERLKDAEVLVVDLTGECLESLALVSGLARSGAGSSAEGSSAEGSSAEQVSRLAGSNEDADAGRRTRPRTLGFYSHVDTATRKLAQRAGFDLVVPRSRMAREGAALVSRLAGE